MKKSINLNLMLNEIKESNDPTILPCTYIILDFETSRNNTVVSEEIGLELGKTIKNKPIVGKYIPVTQPNTNTDNFTGHEGTLSKDKYGNDIVKLNTVPLGVFTSEGYITTINEDGREKSVLAADAVLWKSRFSDAVDLIVEWFNRGININTSCEFLYKNFSVKNGVEYIESPVWFEGHCHLASEYRGDQEIVLPAYKSSKLLSLNDINKFNRLVAQAIDQEKNKEGEEKTMFKKVFELSHDDIRTLLYKELDPQLPKGTYSWIVDVYDDYFIANLESDKENKYYKYQYSKDDDVVTINFDSKEEVVLKKQWVGTSQVQQMQNELNEIKEKLNSANSTIENLTKEKEELETKFNETTEKIISLNSLIEELSPYKEQVEKENYEKQLNEKLEYYSARFEAVKAKDKFESDEVQELIKKSLKSDDEGKEAILKLNSILVDLVPVQNEQKEIKTIREMASVREDLLPSSDDFDSKYK